MGARASNGPDEDPGLELLVRLRQGDPSAFPALFRAYRRLVWRVLRHLLGDDPELEDVTQAAFLEVYRSIGSFEGRAKLSSWIARVALHCGYRHLRHKKSRPADYRTVEAVHESADPSPSADPEARALGRAASERLRLVLEALPEKKRTVFILVELEGMSHETVAEIVGTNTATVRTRLFYARRAFWEKVARDPMLAELVEKPR